MHQIEILAQCPLLCYLLYISQKYEPIELKILRIELTSEMYYLQKFTSKEKLRQAIERYIHFYNTRRYQKRLRCMTPMELLNAFAA